MIREIRRQFAKQPQPRRRRLYTTLSVGLFGWLLGCGSLVLGTFYPGRSLTARIFSGLCLLFVLGLTAAFVRVFSRLARLSAGDEDG